MMFTDVNDALPGLIYEVLDKGQEQSTRNGPVITLTSPIIVTIRRPWQRVLLNPVRRANPFLFLLDGLSILSNIDLVKPLSDISPRMLEFSDDGVHIRGHYGKRLHSQLPTVLRMLFHDMGSRRIVMQIWDRNQDLDVDSRDIPCNVMVIPRVVDDKLSLTVVNRSNDLFWGMMGANVVQFSFLQEFLATALEKKMGSLHQISTNLHIYTEMGPGSKLNRRDVKNGFSHLYAKDPVEKYPPVRPLDMPGGPSIFCGEVNCIFTALAYDEKFPPVTSEFLGGVVLPMIQSWKEKSTRPLRAYPDCDWFQAARMWWRE